MSATRVIVGLSGGVDSAVAALLLVEEGHDVHAVFMDNWDGDDDAYCTSAQDFQDARQVADTLGIPLTRVNFAPEYRERVFRYFLDEYAAGRTPNPDVLCNSEIKFRAFLDHALRLGAEFIATGHYARLRHEGRRVVLLKAQDAAKDQSYFLHAVPASALMRTLFPVGELQKNTVRKLAKRAGFANFDKKDSTGICFIGERPFREFLMRYLPARPGPICTPEGETVGEHLGLMYYTLGQRQGLRIGGRRGADEAPWYVADKDVANNVLVVVQGHDHPLLLCEALEATALRWIGDVPRVGARLAAKTRYRQADQPCEITALEGERCTVRFTTPQRAITPGQYVVFYDGEICLGGGIIERGLHVAAAHAVSRAAIRLPVSPP